MPAMVQSGVLDVETDFVLERSEDSTAPLLGHPG
jgi:hypothetical protein